MKKYIFVMMAAAALFTACDPQIDNKDWSGQTVSADELTVNIVNQYDLNADGTYTKSADGNYVEFATSPSKVVEVYYINNKGAEMILSKGKPNGIFPLAPARGSEPVQTVYFRTREYDGSSVTVSTQVTVKVATDLSTEMKLFCSNSGSKKWFWCPTAVEGGAVWGNGGYQAGAQDGSENINGAWWGCGVEDGTATGSFSKQLQHSAAGKITGEEYSTSYMQFNEDGTVDKFDKDGNKLGTGSFSIDDYNNGEPIDANLNVAYLNTSEGAILWPYAINKDGFQPTRFEVAHLSVDRMVLIYAAPGTGSWSECTWWSFSSNDDLAGYLTTSPKWGWAPTAVEGGAVWGNAGYQAGPLDGSGAINGAWWGCGVEDGTATGSFSKQLQHSAAGKITGEEYSTSFMTFGEDGIIAKFDKDGNKLGEGSWSIEKGATPGGFNATLKTTEGAILWPYAINKDGFQPTAFEIGYISKDKMILVYAPEGTGGWSECSWWSFGAQK